MTLTRPMVKAALRISKGYRDWAAKEMDRKYIAGLNRRILDDAGITIADRDALLRR